MEIILVRHTSVDVPRGTCYGQTDVPVAPTFGQEAARTKAALAEHTPFDKVYTSPLTRARLLAAYCGYADATPDDRLKEMDMGRWEMLRYDDIRDPYIEEWYADYMHKPTPGGESFDQLRRRVADFLDELCTKDYGRVAIFAHGGVLVAAGIYGGLFGEAGAWEHQVEYGGTERIEL